MKERYIPAFIMLVAGTIVSIINIMNKAEPVAGLRRLLLVIVIFYIIGLIVRAVIKKILAPKPKQSDGEETEENEGEAQQT